MGHSVRGSGGGGGGGGGVQRGARTMPVWTRKAATTMPTTVPMMDTDTG